MEFIADWYGTGGKDSCAKLKLDVKVLLFPPRLHYQSKFVHISVSISPRTLSMLHGVKPARHHLASWTRCQLARPRHRTLLTLAIETSCDDTCVAILSKQNGPRHSAEPQARLLFNEKITVRNTGHGGIHPIEALDSHRTNLSKLVAQSLSCLPEACPAVPGDKRVWFHDGTVKQKPDLIAVTRGPGMRSNLSCGLDTAKGLATAWQIPMVGVHHMQAHALTPRLAHALGEDDGTGKVRDQQSLHEPMPQFPFLTLLISGGHTMLVHSKGLVDHSILATTRDTAIGDALDKCGRVILPEEIRQKTRDTAYGKYLSSYAFRDANDFAAWPIPRRRGDETQKPVNQFGWQIQSPLAETRDLAFSFTGISSRANSLMHERMVHQGTAMSSEERILLARTALGTAFEHLGSRTVMALEKLRDEGIEIATLVASGGVAANDFLRYFLRQMLNARSFAHVKLVFPPVDLCTDNAAMIAWAGMEMFEAGYRTDLGCDARRKWSMDPRGEDGGLLGGFMHPR